MAAVLETRLRHAQSEKLTPIDLVSALVSDELLRRQDRLLERRHKQAGFRDPHPSLDNFDFDFNKKMNRALIHELATGRFIAQREDALFLGPYAPTACSEWRTENFTRNAEGKEGFAVALRCHSAYMRNRKHRVLSGTIEF